MGCKILITIFLILAFIGCKNKDTSYLYHDKLPALEKDENIYQLSLLQLDNKIDVIMIIDNSGSMGGIQKNVIRNSELFFTQFAKSAGIDWKIGIISTDKYDDPYLGFLNSFDSYMIDPNDPTTFSSAVQKFNNAVYQLGVYGDVNEYTFYNMKRMIDRFSNTRPFLRSNAHLVTIMISDENEQSAAKYGAFFEAFNFYNEMSNYIDRGRKLRFYGAIGHRDLKDCPSDMSTGHWVGSEFEKIITLSGGFVVSACVANFGAELIKIGKDLKTLIGLPSLLLKKRPEVSTLRVFYRDQELKAGPESEGGFWFYEERYNTINFYNLEFVKDINKDTFRIEFDVKDGVDREN